jgi:hypothetical protein
LHTKSDQNVEMSPQMTANKLPSDQLSWAMILGLLWSFGWSF